jgi:hypothetical protein
MLGAVPTGAAAVGTGAVATVGGKPGVALATTPEVDADADAVAVGVAVEVAAGPGRTAIGSDA